MIIDKMSFLFNCSLVTTFISGVSFFLSIAVWLVPDEGLNLWEDKKDMSWMSLKIGAISAISALVLDALDNLQTRVKHLNNHA